MATYGATNSPGVNGQVNGVVFDFDEFVGLGYVRSEAGHGYLFHCIDIVDGSRFVNVGASVKFETVTRFKKSEAVKIEPS